MDAATSAATLEPSHAELPQRLAGLLRALSSAPGPQTLAIDETVIFLAIGALGLTIERPLASRRPVSFAEVAALTNIPRETVRRKAGRLADHGLLERTGGGLSIKDLGRWMEISGRLLEN